MWTVSSFGIMSNVMNIHIASLCVGICFHFPQGRNLEVELLGHICLIFYKLPNCFSKQFCYFTYSVAMDESFSFSTSLPTTGTASLFDVTHFSGYVGVLIISSLDSHLFRCLFTTYISSLARYLFKSIAHLLLFCLFACLFSIQL